MRNRVKATGYLFIFLAGLLSSCEKEIPLDEAILGKWNVQSVRRVTYQAGVKKNEFTFYLEADEMSVQFAENGAGIWYENGDISGTFNWTLAGDIIKVNFGFGEDQWEVSIDGDIIIWSYPDTETIEQVTYNYEYFYTAKRAAI